MLLSPISGVLTIKFAVLRAIVLPLDVRFLIRATVSTRAERIAIIMSDGDGEDDRDADGDDVLESSLIPDERDRVLNVDSAALSDEGAAREEVDAVDALPFDCASEYFVVSLSLVSSPSLFSDVPGAPNAKKGGRKDPGREA